MPPIAGEQGFSVHVQQDQSCVRKVDSSKEGFMSDLQQKRRSFLFGLAGLGISQTLLQGQTAAQAATAQGYVLGSDGGEHLVHFRNPGNILIKIDPATGSSN